jgi:hypothetical protein
MYGEIFEKRILNDLNGNLRKNHPRNNKLSIYYERDVYKFLMYMFQLLPVIKYNSIINKFVVGGVPSVLFPMTRKMMMAIVCEIHTYDD